MKFCDDDDVWRYFRESRAIEAMEDTFRMSAEGELDSPPRFGVDTPSGHLSFTTGGAAQPHPRASIGFRCYDLHQVADATAARCVTL